MASQLDIGDPGAGFRVELDFYAAGTEIIRESYAGIFASCSFHGDGVDRLIAGTRASIYSILSSVRISTLIGILSILISKSQYSQACILRGGQM